VRVYTCADTNTRYWGEGKKLKKSCRKNCISSRYREKVTWLREATFICLETHGSVEKMSAQHGLRKGPGIM
jgi:hypothetical protein